MQTPEECTSPAFFRDPEPNLALANLKQRLLPWPPRRVRDVFRKKELFTFLRSPSSSYLGLQGALWKLVVGFGGDFFVNNRKCSKSRGERSLAGTRKKGRAPSLT